ncbi:MAG TPA: hypothetical protein PKA39_06520, partial [Ignavibacteria bacterium]|nr:hypothetical protein [Ignavibacteria bacterium]
MKITKLILALVLFSGFSAIFAQELQIVNSPYENVDEIISKRKSFNREKWFYEQRMYPNNYIPEDAYINAVKQRDEMRKNNGFVLSSASPWVSLGPTSGFYSSYSYISGRVTTARYNPLNPSIIYIGAAFGGVWKSTNGGSNFFPTTDNTESMSSGSVVVDPVNTNIVYYGTGEATYSAASYYGRGIMKSTNAGTSWTNYTSGLPSQTYCSRLVIRPGFSNQLFAAMGTSGLYKSTDAGVNWTIVLGGRCDDIVFSPDGNNAYIAGNGTGYRVSTDGGVTFNANSTLTMGTRNHLAICR